MHQGSPRSLACKVTAYTLYRVNLKCTTDRVNFCYLAHELSAGVVVPHEGADCVDERRDHRAASRIARIIELICTIWRKFRFGQSIYFIQCSLKRYLGAALARSATLF